jgi:hypothetical protein
LEEENDEKKENDEDLIEETDEIHVKIFFI